MTFCFAVFLFLAAAAWAAAPLRVAASFSVLGDWAAVVGGGDIQLTVMTGPGGDPHTHEPSPKDARTLSQADLVLRVGGGFEPWMGKLLAAGGGEARIFTALDAVERRMSGDEVDPHFWGDPLGARAVVKDLAEAFARMDPARAGNFRRRAAAYDKELAALDDWTRGRVAVLPAARRLLVTNHDTMGYWAERYGFQVVDTVLSSPGTDTADPSAAHLAALAKTVRARGVPAVFIEAATDGRLARALAGASGARVAPPLFTDALDVPGTPAGTYLGMMRHNTDVIVESLQ